MRYRFSTVALLLILVLLAAGCVAPPATAPTASDDGSGEETAAESSGEPTELVVSTWGFNQDLIDENLTRSCVAAQQCVHRVL